MLLPDHILVAIKTMLATVIASGTLYFIYIWGQDIERFLNPVVGRLEITKMEPVDDTRTRIWITFEKMRECRPLEVYWYRGHRTGVFERVILQIEKPMGTLHYYNRPLGVQTSGPWVVGVPMDEIKTRAFSDAHHDCWPFWTTVSRFYN